jgi:aspartyl protease family protein
MIRFFTVKWPRPARLEARLLFAAIVFMCGGLDVGRSVWTSSFALIIDDSGMPQTVLFWMLLVMMLAGPYLCVMMAVDRLLAVRKGFAVLSILSVLAWAAVAAALSLEWAAVLPASAWKGSGDFVWQAAIAAGIMSLLIHGGALRTGLADRGFVGLRLSRQSSPYADRLRLTGNKASMFSDDIESKAWFAPNPRARNEREPHRGNGGILLGILAWGCIFTTVIGGYVFYHDISDAVPYSLEKPLPPPLPRVITAGTEASSGQRHDGHFVFATMVNGRPVPMFFDTGASMVTLRAEDAGRLGIPVARLKFSRKVSTANGIGVVAATTIDTLTVGAVTQHDVPAFVASPGTLRENLLGQSFLNKLQGYTVENNRVVLKAY